MPAKSEKQRRLMAAARSYKRGDYKGEVSEEIKRIAASMSDDELSDYMTKEAFKREAVYGADKLLEEFKTSPGKASAKAAGIAALSGATGYGIYKYLQKKKKEHKKGDTYPDWVNPVLGTHTGAITAALALAAYNNLPKEAAMYTVGKGSNNLLNPDEYPVGTAKPSDPNFTSDKMNMAAVKEAPTGSTNTPITGGTPSTPMPPMQGTSVYSNLSSGKKKKSTLEVSPEDWQLDSQVADHKKNASDYVDAMIRKRAQDGGMLQAYPRVAHGAAQAQLNKLRGVQQPTYKTPTNMQEAEQLIRQLYPTRSWPAARAAAQKAFAIKAGANIPTTPVLLAQSQGPTGSAMTSDSAAQGSSTGSAMSAGLPSRVTPTTQQAPVKAPSKPLPVNKPSQPLPVTQSSKPLPTRPASKGLPTKAPSQPLPVTARKNPYKADFAALNRDLKAMSRPAYTPVGPKPANLTVRRGRVPTPPTPTKTTGGIDPATYKGKLQDVVYGDRHYRLPMYEGKARDFLKSNPMWLKQHGEGDKSMGLVKNYKAIPKKAEELVDELLVKRAACGKSHNSRKKKRSKYAKQYKKNIKKAAAEKSGAPENPFDRIDEAIDMMVKEAAGTKEILREGARFAGYGLGGAAAGAAAGAGIGVAAHPEAAPLYAAGGGVSGYMLGLLLKAKIDEGRGRRERDKLRKKKKRSEQDERNLEVLEDLYKHEEKIKKKAKVADEDVFELSGDFVYPEKVNKELLEIQQSRPGYSGPTNVFTEAVQNQIAPTQETVSGMADKITAMEETLRDVKKDSGNIKDEVVDFLNKTERTQKTLLDPKVLSGAVPGPLAGAAAGGGAGLLLTRLLAEDPTLTNYLTGAGVGTGLGILASLAAKKYTRDLAKSINQTMADADKNDTNEGTA